MFYLPELYKLQMAPLLYDVWQMGATDNKKDDKAM